MNVLFICDEYPPGRNGGIGTMVQVLGRELVRQGHKVCVVGLYSHQYGQADFEVDNGVQVHRLRYGLKLPVKAESRLYNLFEKLPDVIKRNLSRKNDYKKYIQFINTLIEKEKIDIIEIQDWNSYNRFLGFIAEMPPFKIPLVVKSNGSESYFLVEMDQSLNKKRFETDNLLYQRADALSSVSQYTADVNKALFNLQQRKVKILHNSIEFPSFIENGIKREKKQIVFTGTLMKKKGIFSLMEAWNIVNKHIPDAQLIVYGKGKTEYLKSLLNNTSVETVNFKGHTTRENLFKALSSATLAIFPSYSEAFALAPLEAMAVGCPIINTSRSSGKELIQDGENGSLIDPDNIEEIAEKIIELIENEKLQELYSTKGRETILNKFTIHKSAQDHIDYYTEVINEFTSK